MADKRAYFTLDVGYLTNPKIAPLLDSHPRAVLLHIECIAYSAQHLTDGVVPMLLAMRLACAEQCHMDMLVQSGLVLDQGDGSVVVHDYLEHQRSASDVKRASDKAQRAAAARWGDAPSNASSMPTALPTAMPREKEREKERTTTSRGSDKPTPARAVALPDSWTPTSEHRDRATSDGLDVDREAIKFQAHAAERGRTAKNWNAAFTRWLMNAAEYAKRDGARGTRSIDRQGDLLRVEMERARAADARAGRLEIRT